MGWLGRCGRWLMARLAAFAGACRKRLGRGPTAGDPPVTVTPYAWQDARYPHSSTGLWIVHTDFSSGYQSATARDAQRAFFPAHVDALMSGSEPTGGYPVGLVHKPYIFLAFPQSDTTAASLIAAPARDYEAWCTANAQDEEDGYLHYATGATTYADPITSISAAGLVTLKYDTQTYASVYANGQTVTIAGNTSSGYNTSGTISGVTVSGGVTQFQLSWTAAAGTGGTLTRVATGAKAKENRYRFAVSGWPPPRWCIHPASTVRQAYEIDRTARIYAGDGTNYVPEGIYVDEVAANNFGMANVATREYAPANAAQFYTDLGALFAAIRTSVDPAPSKWVYEIGSGSYTNANTILLDEGAKSAQKEQMLDLTIGNAWPGSSSTYVLNRLAAGCALELASPNTLNDTITWGGGVYASDPVPPSVHDASNVRMAASCFALALLLVDPVTYPGQLALNIANGHYNLPTYDTGGLDNKWLDLWKAPLGTPTAAYTTLATGTDPLGQPVNVYSRPFASGGLVVYRRCSGYDPLVKGDTAAFTVTLPTSSGATGQWQRVKSDGTLDSPITAIALRPPEGAILLPA